jgi:hypothetical protein
MSFEKPWGNYLLEAIVETKAPDSISFWPQTIAWQIVIFIAIMLLIKKCYQIRKNYLANAYRREALLWLENCSLTNEKDIRQLPALLKKTALLAIARQINESETIQLKALALQTQREMTGLRSEAWIKWLDLHCSKTHFKHESILAENKTHTFEDLLDQLAYMRNINFDDVSFNQDIIKLKQQIELWIKYHDVSIEVDIIAAIDKEGIST